MNERAFGCVGTTIRLASGRYLDLARPMPADISLQDVAGGLSKLCRFGGQISRFYSVAEHSVACCELARLRSYSRPVLRACLLHDAAEAFIGDVVKPLKNLIAPLYSPLEEGIEAAIAWRFEVDFASTAESWKLIDRTMLIAEKRALFTGDGTKWAGEDEVERIEWQPQCLAPAEAEARFLLACYELGVPFHG